MLEHVSRVSGVMFGALTALAEDPESIPFLCFLRRPPSQVNSSQRCTSSRLCLWHRSVRTVSSCPLLLMVFDFDFCVLGPSFTSISHTNKGWLDRLPELCLLAVTLRARYPSAAYGRKCLEITIVWPLDSPIDIVLTKTGNWKWGSSGSGQTRLSGVSGTRFLVLPETVPLHHSQVLINPLVGNG